MDVDKIAKSLLNECKDCGERFCCDKGEQLIYCPNRDAAERLKELNDFQSSQCAKLLARLTVSYARIAELEAKVKRYDEKIEKLAVTINSLYAEAKKMLERDAMIKADLSALQSHDKEAMELLEAALKDLMIAADDNGGCYGCMNLDADEKCTSEQGREMCNCETNNMWRWQRADRYEALKAQSPTKNTDGEG